jgi:hypothetical protein
LREQLSLVDVLADRYVDGLERSAGLEVEVDVGARFDVSAAGDGRLNDAVLGADDLPRGSGRAARRADLDDRKRSHGDGDHRKQVEVPGTRAPFAAHDCPLSSGDSPNTSADDPRGAQLMLISKGFMLPIRPQVVGSAADAGLGLPTPTSVRRKSLGFFRNR